ncbi:uncharacterized protein LOC111366793 [Olea europaea var. sylvestris]|uniref:uncharacterized protein LOC111366793 n=1 Tax=Olea europaea var. sylvestris TaxID=158386 RepID=UPI000C1D1754|nr:uncharacterized protein LOC111366793 [Olea europaea var. sylvestris]
MKDQVEESMQEKNLACEKDEATTPTARSKVDSKSSIPTYVPSPPFLDRSTKSKGDEHEKEIVETFRKVQVNIPLLDAIYQLPHYAKFLKELCTNKHRLKGNEVFGKAVLDLGASINVMPYSIYASLNLESLKEIDFYVLDIQDEPTSLSPPLLLRRPFMRTGRTKIDVHDGTLTMEFDGEIIRFNIFETMTYPSDVHACFSIDIMDLLVQKVFELSNEDALDTTLIKCLDANNLTRLSKNLLACKDVVETVASLESLPSIPPRNDLSYITLPISKEKLLPSVM